MKFTNEISRDLIISNNPIEKVIQSYGIELKKQGGEFYGICCFHADKSPSLRVNIQKQTYYCDPCGKGGSVIDFVANKENISIGEAMQKLSGEQPEHKPEKAKEVCRYSYTDEFGNVLYKVIRYFPKTFKQCRSDEKGHVVWNMEGVKRVLYNLPQVAKAKTVWIVEGEKDADALKGLCLVATCNVGGAGKWMDAYNESLNDKNIVICPDNDAAGKKHLDSVMSSIAGKVKTVCVVKVPEPYKDASDYIESFKDKESAGNALCKLEQDSPKITGGIDIPIYGMEELESQYSEFVSKVDSSKLDLSAWLPGFKNKIRGLVPGEFMVVLADTGVGKTAILQNISYHARPLTVLLFSIELPTTLVFERYLQINNFLSGQNVEDSFKDKKPIDWRTKQSLNHIHVCPISKLTTKLIEELIIKSELKIGKKPDVVMIDYIGLIKGEGKSRYENISTVSEDLKIIAKSTNTIVIAASQIHRKGDQESGEIFLHDAKDSGSVENSCGFMLGVWKESKSKMNIKVLKGSKGGTGLILPCEFHGETMRIWQEH